MSIRILFAKTHEGAKTPVRANLSDAGMDVFYCPEGWMKGEMEEYMISLMPGENKAFPTGLKFEVPHGYALIGFNKSGIAVKRSLALGACVIDSGYNGEVFVDLHNIGTVGQTIIPGQKIAQLVLVPVVHCLLQETEPEVLYRDEGVCYSNRGDGALGSTGDK